jgi:hypothetical protein
MLNEDKLVRILKKMRTQLLRQVGQLDNEIRRLELGIVPHREALLREQTRIRVAKHRKRLRRYNQKIPKPWDA